MSENMMLSTQKCVICGHMHHVMSMTKHRIFNPKTTEYENYYVCYECGEKLDGEDAIDSYSFKPEPVFYNVGSSDLYLGVELEADEGYGPHLAAQRIRIPYREFYIKHDGSLGNNGIEVVSHPGTLEAHRRNVMHWKEVIAILKSQHYRSHKTSTCGLHVHVNRSFFGDTEEEIDLNVSKVIMLTQRFWDECIVPFSRRNLARLERWAKKPQCKFTVGVNPKDVTKVHKDRLSRDHYNGVNIMPRNTIEFRMFRGTLNYKTLMATLEFVYVFCHYVKKIEMNQIDETNWDDIFTDVNRSEFKYLFDYLGTRTKINPEAHEDVFFRPTISDKKSMDVSYRRGIVVDRNTRNFAPGDLVRIRDWDDMENEFGLDSYGDIDVMFTFTRDMRFLCGHLARIDYIGPRETYELLFVNDADQPFASEYFFSAGMLELCAEEVTTL